MKNFLQLLIIAFILITSSGFLVAQENEWPILKHYDENHVDQVALPLGGIGTGTVSLGGRGNLLDWEIMNRPAKGYNPGPRFEIAPFFVLYTKQGNKTDTRLLEGPVPLYNYEGSRGVDRTTNHGMPRFEKSTFETAYPFGIVNLVHEGLPVEVRIKGFNPFVPTNADKSGIPIAVLRFEVTNTTDEIVETSLCGSMQNFIGDDGKFGVAKGNVNDFTDEANFKGIFFSSESVDKSEEQWGTMALVTSSVENVTYRTNWKKQHWGSSILDFWDDFSQDGELEERSSTGEDMPMASLATKFVLKPGERKEIEYHISWHFPNRMAWASSMLKNYYITQYSDALDVVQKTLPQLQLLEKETIEFVDAFIHSDLPEEVKEAALFNLSTLRTQTCFRTDDGYFYTWEGCNDDSGCCFGSCTHVWNYEHATGFLFGELAKGKREIEFGMATNTDGLMSFRVRLPKENTKAFGLAAADGQMGAIMKMYRDWQLSGDNEMLKRLYPNVKKALQFCWIPGGWDADTDGVMEGIQHNTMDVEYYGPNPQMGIWYLGALRSVAAMATQVGDKNFAKDCLALYSNGRKWIDSNLFNGEYYIHKIQIPDNIENINPSLVIGMGGDDKLEPDYQLGEGCLVDQLVGQYVAHICGLGYLVDPRHVQLTLKSIMKYNYQSNLKDHFNSFRTYALGDESALLMASYPNSRPVNPFPYFTEVMTGFEYTAAVGMLYEGLDEDGLLCIRNIRNRYDGFKRSPFDEAECGHHYGRAMASWSSVLALTDFNYSAVSGILQITSDVGNHFWSTGYAFGTIHIEDEVNFKQVRIKIIQGSVKLNEIQLKAFGKAQVKTRTLKKGDELMIRVKRTDSKTAQTLNVISDKKFDIVSPVEILDNENEIIRIKSFDEPFELSMNCSTVGTKIRYTLDGSEPHSRSALYSEPILIKEPGQIKALAFLRKRSGLVSTHADFIKVKNYAFIELVNSPSQKYPGKGAQTLVDGIKGTSNFSDGRWLGFEGNDLEIILDMGEKKEINQIKVGLFKSEDSWIFLPENIRFFYSTDGITYSENLILPNSDISKKDGSLYEGILKVDLSESIQYIKIMAKNIGTCPDGHEGEGNKAWLFVDEITIE